MCPIWWKWQKCIRVQFGITCIVEKCRIVWYYIYTYYIWASVEMGIIHSQNGWYFLEAWIVPSSISFVEVSERGIVKVTRVIWIHIWRPVKANENYLKNNLSPRVGCCWAINRGLVSVHVNVRRRNHSAVTGRMVTS